MKTAVRITRYFDTLYYWFSLKLICCYKYDLITIVSMMEAELDIHFISVYINLLVLCGMLYRCVKKLSKWCHDF